MIQYCLKPRFLERKVYITPHLLHWEVWKEKPIKYSHWHNHSMQNYTCKLYMCWNICRFAFFAPTISSTLKLLSAGNLHLPLSDSTKFYQDLVWEWSLSLELLRTQTSATWTLLRANFGSMCFVWAKDVIVHFQKLGF